MAVKLRLVRMGKKKQPTYRVVAADSRSPRDGRFLEIVGTYAPRGRSTAEPDAVVDKLLEPVEEREVRLRDRFVEPVFLEEVVIFGMTDEG